MDFFQWCRSEADANQNIVAVFFKADSIRSERNTSALHHIKCAERIGTSTLHSFRSQCCYKYSHLIQLRNWDGTVFHAVWGTLEVTNDSKRNDCFILQRLHKLSRFTPFNIENQADAVVIFFIRRFPRIVQGLSIRSNTLVRVEPNRRQSARMVTARTFSKQN